MATGPKTLATVDEQDRRSRLLNLNESSSGRLPSPTPRAGMDEEEQRTPARDRLAWKAQAASRRC
jgi:hypothetical protein